MNTNLIYKITIFTMILMSILSCINKMFIKSDVFLPEPGVNLSEVNFVVFPHIKQEGDKYFLCYQIDTSVKSPLVRVLYTRQFNEKAYYFFSIPISHIESGKMVTRGLDQDGFIEHAKNNNIYWLNEDGTELQLKILKN